MSAMITYAAVSGAVMATSMANSSGGSSMPMTDTGAVLLLIAMVLLATGFIGMMISMVRMKFDAFDDFCVKWLMMIGWSLSVVLILAAFIHDLYA